jgi:hypothetical protein
VLKYYCLLCMVKLQFLELKWIYICCLLKSLTYSHISKNLNVSMNPTEMYENVENLSV